MNKAVGLGVFAVVVAGGFWAVMASRPAAETALYLDSARVSQGAELYDENCASCHGADLKGQPNWKEKDGDGYMPAPPHDRSGHTWHHPTEQLFAVTKFGTAALVGNGYQSRMIGFKDQLSDDQIYSILAYIKSTWPDQIIQRHDAMDAASGS